MIDVDCCLGWIRLFLCLNTDYVYSEKSMTSFHTITINTWQEHPEGSVLNSTIKNSVASQALFKGLRRSKHTGFHKIDLEWYGSGIAAEATDHTQNGGNRKHW